MNKLIKSKNGITLLVLVITIIIMIILAGVTLRLTIGDEGVITHSMNAKMEHEKSVYKELITLEVAAEKINGTDISSKSYLENIQKRLEEKKEFEGAEYEIKNGNALVITTKEGYKFAVMGEEVILADDGIGDTEIPEIKDGEINFKTTPSYWVNTGVTLEISSPKHPFWIIEQSEDTANWTEYSGKMTVDSNKTIYARLKNDVGISENYATHSIINIDKAAPVLTSQSFKTSSVNTRGFTVELEVQDVESGIAQIVWNYKLKSDTNWTKSITDVYHMMHTKDSGDKSLVKKSHAFDKMSSGTYMIQANIYDVAGNITLTEPIEISIGSIDDEVENSGAQSSLTYEPTWWTNEHVTVKLPTVPNLETRYTTNGSIPTVSSTKYDPDTPIVVTQNTRIYYIYTDGVNISKCATKEVTNIDKDKVAIRTELKGIDKTTDGFTLGVGVEDEPTNILGRSGLSKIDWYYKLSTSSGEYNVITDTYKAPHVIESGETNKVIKTKQLTGLEGGIYLAYVEIYDVAGNVTSTKDTPIQVEVVSIPELIEGNSTFEPTYWTNEDVKVTLTKEDGFRTMYTDDKSIPTLTNPNLKEYNEPFTVSENSRIQYIYTDGKNISNIGTKNITNIDKTPADISNFVQSEVTTNGFSLSANIRDGESGIGKIVFYYKHQDDPNFYSKEWSNPNGISLKMKPSLQAGTTNLITAEESFTDLRAGIYECYIQVFNTAGVEAISNTINFELEAFPMIENASFSPSGWTNGDVRVTLPTASGVKTLYTLDGTNPTLASTEFSSPFNVSKNCTVKYIYTDGTNITDARSKEITNIDKEVPTVISEISELNVTKNSITASIEVKDNLSGLGKIVWYYKKATDSGWTNVQDLYTTMNGTSAGAIEETKTHIFNDLEQNVKYQFYADVYDVAGNKVTSRLANNPLEITTLKQEVTGIVLNPQTATVGINGTVTVTATVLPSDAYNKNLKWSLSGSGLSLTSQNSTSATVKGITATSTAILTATAEDGSEISASSTIKVKSPPIVSQVSKSNYGDYVNYDVDLGIKSAGNALVDGNVPKSDWRIFYKDSNYVYLIAADYVPTSKIPYNRTGMSFSNGYNVSWNSTGNTAGTPTTVYQNNFLYSNISKIDSNKEKYKVASCLVDTTKWEGFVTDTAEACIGSPTIEMLSSSWNELYTTEKILYNVSSEGYSVGSSHCSVQNNTNNLLYLSTSNSTKDYYSGYSNTLYFPHNNPNNRTEWNSCSGYWLAAPAAFESNPTRLCIMWYNARLAGNGVEYKYYALRPVVMLKKDTGGIKDSNGVWQIE